MLNNSGIKRELNKNIIVKKILENGDMENIDESQIRDNGIIVTLGDKLSTFNKDVINLGEKQNWTKEVIKDYKIIKPHVCYLGCTNEYTETLDYVPMLDGLPELAMAGIKIHVTAGFGDNGYKGTWTLEIESTSEAILYPGMEIGKITYIPVVGNGNILYSGKYVGQIDPTESRLSEEYNGHQRVRK